MKNLCILLPVLVAVVAFFNISMTNASTISADKLTLITPDPTSGGFTQSTSEISITFNLAYTVTGAVTLSRVHAYFSHGDGSTQPNTISVAVGNNAADGTVVTTSGTFTALTGTIRMDNNCAITTKLCAAIVLKTSDADTSDDFTCIDFGVGPDKAGTKTCNGIAATTLTLSTPATGGFIQGIATAITFNLAYTVNGDGAAPSAVKLYFSDAIGSIKSTQVTAGGDGVPSRSNLVAKTSSGTYSALTAKVTLDANCVSYNKLCAAIEFTTADAIPVSDEACIDLGIGADKAGTKTCNAGSSATTSSTLMALTMVIAATMSWRT
ncbi:uncharacterized protein LOC144433210 [Glandiceps talaboti]